MESKNSKANPIRVAVIMGKMNSGGKKTLAMEYFRHMDHDKIKFDFICDADSNAIPTDEIKQLGAKSISWLPTSTLSKIWGTWSASFGKTIMILSTPIIAP